MFNTMASTLLCIWLSVFIGPRILVHIPFLVKVHFSMQIRLVAEAGSRFLHPLVSIKKSAMRVLGFSTSVFILLPFLHILAQSAWFFSQRTRIRV